MNALERLIDRQQAISSKLCVGLDTELTKIPEILRGADHPITSFNSAIIESTLMHAAAYKINTAFYEQYGESGWEAMKQTVGMIPENVFTIADAKRADIGNTSSAYARALFDDVNCDAITVNPYMGHDSLSPFLEREDRMVIVLALTSNPGSGDFQRLMCDGKPLYRHVIEKVLSWDSKASIGFVIGATHPEELSIIREYAPESLLLIPGIGAQGGDIDAIMEANAGGPVLINVSRAIQYAGNGMDFGEKACEAAQFYKERIGSS